MFRVVKELVKFFKSTAIIKLTVSTPYLQVPSPKYCNEGFIGVSMYKILIDVCMKEMLCNIAYSDWSVKVNTDKAHSTFKVA